MSKNSTALRISSQTTCPLPPSSTWHPASIQGRRETNTAAQVQFGPIAVNRRNKTIVSNWTLSDVWGHSVQSGLEAKSIHIDLRIQWYNVPCMGCSDILYLNFYVPCIRVWLRINYYIALYMLSVYWIYCFFPSHLKQHVRYWEWYRQRSPQHWLHFTFHRPVSTYLFFSAHRRHFV